MACESNLGWVTYLCQHAGVGFMLYICADGIADLVHLALARHSQDCAEAHTRAAQTWSSTDSDSDSGFSSGDDVSASDGECAPIITCIQ